SPASCSSTRRARARERAARTLAIARAEADAISERRQAGAQGLPVVGREARRVQWNTAGKGLDGGPLFARLPVLRLTLGGLMLLRGRVRLIELPGRRIHRQLPGGRSTGCSEGRSPQYKGCDPGSMGARCFHKSSPLRLRLPRHAAATSKQLDPVCNNIAANRAFSAETESMWPLARRAPAYSAASRLRAKINQST